jgi:hypothetical protein
MPNSGDVRSPDAIDRPPMRKDFDGNIPVDHDVGLNAQVDTTYLLYADEG